MFFTSKAFGFLISISSILIFAACPAPNTSTNLSNNSIVNSNTTNTNAPQNAATSAIETKEPEKYQATVKLKFMTTGEQKLTIPGELQANVAKNGQNQRMEFSMPNGDKVVYLDVGGKHLVVLPNRKQYAEIGKESVGFEVRSMMTPGQIVSQVKSMKGVEKIGEEKYGDRDAIKYQYGAVTDTKTKAGSVETKSFIYIDKETGLPLHSETTAVASGGNYQGVQGLQVVTEMANIKTEVDPALFAEPTDFAKVAPEQVKQQVDAIFSVAMTFLGQLLKTGQTTTSPTAAP
jgi:hypothetical protein